MDQGSKLDTKDKKKITLRTFPSRCHVTPIRLLERHQAVCVPFDATGTFSFLSTALAMPDCKMSRIKDSCLRADGAFCPTDSLAVGDTSMSKIPSTAAIPRGVAGLDDSATSRFYAPMTGTFLPRLPSSVALSKLSSNAPFWRCLSRTCCRAAAATAAECCP